MLIQDNSKLARGHAMAVAYTGKDAVFVTRVNRDLVRRVVALRRQAEDERFADDVRLAEPAPVVNPFFPPLNAHFERIAAGLRDALRNHSGIHR